MTVRRPPSRSLYYLNSASLLPPTSPSQGGRGRGEQRSLLTAATADPVDRDAHRRSHTVKSIRRTQRVPGGPSSALLDIGARIDICRPDIIFSYLCNGQFFIKQYAPRRSSSWTDNLRLAIHVSWVHAAPPVRFRRRRLACGRSHREPRARRLGKPSAQGLRGRTRVGPGERQALSTESSSHRIHGSPSIHRAG